MGGKAGVRLNRTAGAFAGRNKFFRSIRSFQVSARLALPIGIGV
jgi:hypothetical protein